MIAYYGRDPSVVYSLGARLGGGGEGDVYEIKGKPELAAKIFSDRRFIPTAECLDPGQEMREKLETMLDQPVEPYLNGALAVAWPQDLLLGADGQIVGYTMPRAEGEWRHLHTALRERERVEFYSDYNWRTALLIAYNLARTVGHLHEAGVVVGDMSPDSIMLDRECHVALLGTDAFDITNQKTGKIYKCTVGSAELLPPELQSRDLRHPGSRFTRQSDNFALAIHIFILLLDGRHPFRSVRRSPVENILRGYCPYLTSDLDSGTPESSELLALPKGVRQLFDRAYGYTAEDAQQAAAIAKRPDAREWQSVLEDMYSSGIIVLN